MNKKLIDLYNQPGNLLVITNYPPRGEGIHTGKFGGVSGFAKNTLLPLSEKFSRENRKIIILADILDKPQIYEENNMLVVRVWKRDTLKLYLDLLKSIKLFQNISDVLIEFEFASFGDFFTTSIFPLFLAFLRITGKRVTTVLHQVVLDLWNLTGHVGLVPDDILFKIFSVLLPVYYGALTHISDQTIVLEEVFWERLRKIAPVDRVSVIPHGVETPARLLSKKRVRKMLCIDTDEYVVLSFGFVTWYKGTDLLAKGLIQPTHIDGKPLRLIIAGGKSASQGHKKHYQNYYQSVENLVRGKRHITLTGFVKQNEIPLYFAAADVVVFPHRTVMSSSGPVSLALGFEKPILLSESMKAYFKSRDVDVSLKESRVKFKDLLLPNDLEKLSQYLTHLEESRVKRKMKKFVKNLARRRRFTNMADSYYTVLTHSAPVTNKGVQVALG